LNRNSTKKIKELRSNFELTQSSAEEKAELAELNDNVGSLKANHLLHDNELDQLGSMPSLKTMRRPVGRGSGFSTGGSGSEALVTSRVPLLTKIEPINLSAYDNLPLLLPVSRSFAISPPTPSLPNPSLPRSVSEGTSAVARGADTDPFAEIAASLDLLSLGLASAASGGIDPPNSNDSSARPSMSATAPSFSRSRLSSSIAVVNKRPPSIHSGSSAEISRNESQASLLAMLKDAVKSTDAATESGQCEGCREKIAGMAAATVVEYEGRRWHRAHFGCAVCKTALHPDSAKFLDGRIFCEKDYIGMKAKVINKISLYLLFINPVLFPLCFYSDSDPFSQ